MKSRLYLFLAMSVLLAGTHQASAQGTRYFRISGPAASSIITLQPDGSMVWSNAVSGTNYVVQTATALPAGTDWVDYVQLPVTNRINTNQIVAFHPPSGMAFIPAGSFKMGDTLDGEADAAPMNVYVSAFYMDRNLVTYSEWQTVYTFATNHGYAFDDFGIGRASNNPVIYVNWFDCVKWCNARSQMEGLTPVYYLDAGLTQIYTNGEAYTVYPNWATNGYRLPTEAEWEKAARGGLIGQRFPGGLNISENQANYDANTNLYSYDLGPYSDFNTNFDTGYSWFTSPVGYFASNGYGLYDMAGNVYEWCWDGYATPYGQPTPINPTGPSGGPLNRVVRGGNWGSSAYYARCAARNYNIVFVADQYIGFRCVRSH
ncbi:MAG TPA: SUMF1/EgtB/PvdO family nonheme iron enzyme [Verrucomicrobiae bacterium]|nr:SUMF1/EgtB/PvdO family nonheme iron enzyme [Verrucomicrobiae bacterium]